LGAQELRPTAVRLGVRGGSKCAQQQDKTHTTTHHEPVEPAHLA
jgi:hypothetical protein